MICKSITKSDLYLSMDKVGLKNRIMEKKTVIIKINLARPAEPDHPRTDIDLLSDVIEYIYLNNGTCSIAEGANGYLRQNIHTAELSGIVKKYDVGIIDLDLEEVDQISINGEEHFLPKCLKNYGVRIGIPATSKRPKMIFSNNVKLFVGAVPRRMYQVNNDIVDWRPRIHINLHKSVADIYRAIQEYSPFEFFINGGIAVEENIGEFRLNEVLVGNNGVELDLYVLQKYFSNQQVPEYIKILNETN